LRADRIRALLARSIEANPIKFDPGWDRVLDGLKALAEWQTRLLQSGVLAALHGHHLRDARGRDGRRRSGQGRAGPVLDLAEEFDGLCCSSIGRCWSSSPPVRF
jgi:hypothetical protein